jgi:two-component system, NtrC family, nitrogen regulation response regulator GlnG
MDGTVLVADDDRTIRTVLTQALTRAGCKVHATSSLVTLMRWVEEGKGDLVISDVIMPDGNGLDQLPRIAQERPGLPVIVISAQNTIMTAIQAAEADAFDYLPKPFDLPDLMKRAARALEVKRRGAGAEGEGRQGDGRPAARRPHARDAGALPARGPRDEHRASRPHHRRIRHRQVAHRPRDPRLLGSPDPPFVVAGAAELATMEGPATILGRAKNGSILFDEVGDLDEDTQARIVRMLDSLTDNGPASWRRARPISARVWRRGGSGRTCSSAWAASASPCRASESASTTSRSSPTTSSRGRTATACRSAGSTRARWTSSAPIPGPATSASSRTRSAGSSSPGRTNSSRAPRPSSCSATSPRSSRFVAAATGRSSPHRWPSTSSRYFDLHGGVLPPPGLYQRILKEVETPLIEIALDATGGNQAKCADLLGINRNTSGRRSPISISA